MKKLEVQFLNPEITKIKKEQGNVFQKKEAEVEVVTLKGKKRNVHFEKDYAEGAELYL